MLRVLLWALIGALGGFAGGLVLLAILDGLGAYISMSTSMTTLTFSTIGGLFAGGVGGYYLAHRLPPMLPMYRQEHLRLRKLAKQIQANLERLMGAKVSAHELETILRRDAELRAQASRLRKQIHAEARRRLSWMDHLSAGIELLREGARTGSLQPIDWTWVAYRRKLYRELHSLGNRLERNHDPHLEEALTRTYRQKAREVASFEQLERTLKVLENEMTLISSGLDSLLMESTRLSTTAPNALPSVEELLKPLRSQLEAYERAVSEAYRLSTFEPEAEDLHTRLP